MPPLQRASAYAFPALFRVSCADMRCDRRSGVLRPFLDGPASGQVVNGVLWAAFTIFVFFAIIFTCVCVIVARDYSHRRFKGKLTKAERIRFINMKQHIESGRHFYDKGEYCTVCGHKKTGRAPAKK